MQRALELASLGRGSVSPNPMVGCVIVHEGSIIGEGWHQQYGEAHAEVNAIQSVNDRSLLSESTVYVTLEPCAHYGKTPPCADLLVKHKVRKVVIGAVDSNPLVGGKGIEKLQKAGIEVVKGVLEKECRTQNVRFFTSIEKDRPYIILKWAQTADGFIARKNFDSKWISNSTSRQLVHQWRAHEDAILVGPNTAIHDNPRLNVRGIEGKNPIRVLIDRHLSVSGELNLFDQSQMTLVYNLTKSEEQEHLEFIKLPSDDFLDALLKDLHQRKIQSVIIEGGYGILSAFIERGFWDEARVFKAEVEFGDGVSAPKIPKYSTMSQMVKADRLEIYHNQRLR